MSQDEFTKLFLFVQEKFESIEQKLDEKASQSSIDRLMDTIDNFIKRLDNAETEQMVRDHQFEKLLAWARKVSEKTGIPLENL